MRVVPRAGRVGADLSVVAPDAYAVDENDKPVGPIPPGGVAPLFIFVLSDGDKAAARWQSVIQLPEHVTFFKRYAGCVYSADIRTETCEWEGADALGSPGAAEFTRDVKVSEAAPGPVNLTGGIVTVKVLEEAETALTALSQPSSRLKPLGPQEMELVLDTVDPSDNSDAFTVFVGAKPGGGDTPDGGETPGGGSGGSLPITGVQVGVIGVVGAGVLVLGGVLFLVARRRRVVLVTPTDG